VSAIALGTGTYVAIESAAITFGGERLLDLVARKTRKLTALPSYINKNLLFRFVSTMQLGIRIGHAFVSILRVCWSILSP